MWGTGHCEQKCHRARCQENLCPAGGGEVPPSSGEGKQNQGTAELWLWEGSCCPSSCCSRICTTKAVREMGLDVRRQSGTRGHLPAPVWLSMSVCLSYQPFGPSLLKWVPMHPSESQALCNKPTYLSFHWQSSPDLLASYLNSNKANIVTTLSSQQTWN